MKHLQRFQPVKIFSGHHLIVTFALCVLISGQAFGQDVSVDSRTWDKLPDRTWSRVDGKTAIGSLKALEGGKITLLIKEKEYQFETTKFTSTDQKYIDEAAKFKFDTFLGYDQVTVTSVTAAGISLRHAGGVARKSLNDISENWKKFFGVDTLEKVQAKGPAIDKSAWKYSNVDWGLSSEAVGKILGEKGFKLNDALFNLGGEARWSKKSASGKYSETHLEYSGGKVMDKEARIIVEFANDQLHTLHIWMTSIAAYQADVKKVLDTKYNPKPTIINGTHIPEDRWGGKYGKPKNATTILWAQILERNLVCISYDYESAVEKMVEAGFEKEEADAVKKKASGSDL